MSSPPPSCGKEPPTIDLANTPEADIVEQISKACSEFGFFQIVNHSVPTSLIDEYLEQCKLYFSLPLNVKRQWKRHAENSRGWFNDELTKQRLDWKEALDMGVPGTRDWSIDDSDPSNRCLDGWNQLPSSDVLPDFRPIITRYFDECAKLADQIAIFMAKGLGQSEDCRMIQELRDHHSSYLRSNYYPVCDVEQENEDPSGKPLGISPHRDAGFLTVLLQDADCHSLQVLLNHEGDSNSNGNTSLHDNWITIRPADKYAFTINTGDMAEVWSNGRYKAPLHRVLSNETKERYSTPFFYNPSYASKVEPLTISSENQNESGPNTEAEPQYSGVLWGYFRAVRFAGDLTDLGVEIQVADFLLHDHQKSQSDHVGRQEVFAKQVDFSKPFSVEKFRPLLQESSCQN